MEEVADARLIDIQEMIHHQPATTRQSDHDINRTELMWDKNTEPLVREWVKDARVRSMAHARCAKRFKKLYVGLGVPCTLLPIILSGGDMDILPSVVGVSLLLLSGTLTGVANFLNFGSKYARHGEYEQKFAEFYNSAEKELSKPMAFRIACDAYTEHILGKYNRICSGAPDT